MIQYQLERLTELMQGAKRVAVLYRPPYMKNPNFFPIGKTFGFFVYIKDVGF